MRNQLGTLFVALLTVNLSFGQTSNVKPPAKPFTLSQSYGFLPPEIYKLDFQIKNLLVRDLNRDGLMDVIVVNPLQNRLDILEQSKEPGGEPAAKAEVNEIEYDTRLRRRKQQTKRTVGALEIADVNSDNIPDLVYVGEPPALYIEYQSADGEFGKRRTVEISDVQPVPWTVDIGDLNGDGRNDIAVLGRENLTIVHQLADGKLDEPRKFRVSDEGAGLMRVIDIDGNGRADIVFSTSDDQFPIRARFQNKNGRLGPERRFRTDPPTGVTWGNVDGKPGAELLSVSKLSGRLLVSTLAASEKDEESPTSELVAYPFEKASKSEKMDLAVGDFDGDGRPDVAVSDVDAGRVLLYRQTAADGLDVSDAFPSMVGVQNLRSIDIEGKAAALLTLSDRERSIGVCRFQDNRLSFPTPLPTKDEPLAMEVVTLNGGQAISYVARTTSGNADKFVLRTLRPEGKWPVKWTSATKADVDLPAKGKPFDLRTIDANSDGSADLLVFFVFEPPILLLGNGTGDFKPVTGDVNLGKVSPATVFHGKLDGQNSLIVAQTNFARSLRLGADNRFMVIDQFNAADGSAQVQGLSALDLDGDGKHELAMYDRASQSILFLKAKEGLYRSWKQIKVGLFDLKGMRVADFDGDGRPDLMLYDRDKMGITFTGKQDLVLKRIGSYESDIPQGKLADVAVGDLNGDGKPDLLAIEPIQHHMEVLNIDGKFAIRRALRWRVFEEKTFRRAVSGIDPREVVVEDVNNDGLADLVCITHDRVLIYLQDAGPNNANENVKAENKSPRKPAGG